MLWWNAIDQLVPRLATSWWPFRRGLCFVYLVWGKLHRQGTPGEKHRQSSKIDRYSAATNFGSKIGSDRWRWRWLAVSCKVLSEFGDSTQIKSAVTRSCCWAFWPQAAAAPCIWHLQAWNIEPPQQRYHYAMIQERSVVWSKCPPVTFIGGVRKVLIRGSFKKKICEE